MGIDESFDRRHPHASAYHGLTSFFLSGIFLLMAVPALDLASTLVRSNYEGFNATDRRVAAIVGYAGGGLVILFCLVAVGVAGTGIRVSRQTGEPAILCLMGLFLSFFAAFVWIGCVAAWHSQAWRMLQG